MNDAYAQWQARSRAAVWHPCTQMKLHERMPPVPIARAHGAWLYDHRGSRYLDAISSWWVNLFGHANPRVNAALTAQLGDFAHVMLAGFTHAPVIELSERLAALAPAGLGHAFYASDGASAAEIALKMSFHYWQQRGARDKSRYVRLTGGYHGETVGALGVTDVALFRAPYGPLLRDNPVLPSPALRDAVDARSPERAVDDALDALEAYLRTEGATTAALIVEPLIQGAGGMARTTAGREVGREGAHQVGASPRVVVEQRAEQALDVVADIGVGAHDEPGEAELRAMPDGQHVIDADEDVDFAHEQLVAAVLAADELDRVQDGEQRVAVFLDLRALVALARILDGQLVQVELAGDLVELALRRLEHRHPDEAVGTMHVLAHVGDGNVGDLPAVFVGDAADEHDAGTR